MPKILTRDPAWLATGTPGFDLFQPSGSNSSKKLTATKYTGARRKIAHRGTEVFVAVKNELRWSEVGLLKDAADDISKSSGRLHQDEEDREDPGYRVSLFQLSLMKF